jgi:hypothetical protein
MVRPLAGGNLSEIRRTDPVNDVPQHDELPLPDYDHLPTGTLPTRISGLNEAGLAQLLA